MINLEKYTGAVLLGLSIFLMLDASLAFIVGEHYRYWGLRYMPVWYRSFIFKIYASPKLVLWLSILSEFMVGFGLFLYFQKQ